ncbi:MAG: tetratricopeptide repeat protein [Thermodesulfobacteriota bacterium]
MKYPGVICLMLILAFGVCGPVMAADAGKTPAPAALAVSKSRQLLAGGKTREALELLESFQSRQKTVSADEADSRGYTHPLIDFMIGNCRLLLKDPAAAVSHYQAAVNRKPDFTEARLNLARGLYDLNRPAEAAREFTAAYDASGNQAVEALYYGAVSFMEAKDYSLALTVFDRLLKNHPDALTPERRQTLARLYLALERPEQALPHIEFLADQADLKDRQAWRETLIHLYLELHREEKAMARAEAYTRDDPLEPKWWKLQAWLLLSRQDFRRALTALTAYSYLSPLSGEEAALLADVNFTAGIPQEAVRLYEQRLIEKQDPELIKKAVRGYLRLHDKHQALVWVEAGLKLTPGDKDLLAFKTHLQSRKPE